MNTASIETKLVAARIPAEDARQLLELAREHDRPVSSEIRAAIRRYLAEHGLSGEKAA